MISFSFSLLIVHLLLPLLHGALDLGSIEETTALATSLAHLTQTVMKVNEANNLIGKLEKTEAGYDVTGQADAVSSSMKR
jgi:hypothetical protein